ncbi:glycosyltransferase family protein [Janibacter melonis]|uniref:glycosyltransferase n=1 Tax=Janibacter melonis TaxID=262209 RepID=UPI00174E096E|nr:glycosyltransferase [Janibacter melonis]
MSELLRELDRVDLAHQVAITGTPADYGDFVREHRRTKFIGVVPSEVLDDYWRRADVIFFPPTLEAFGYPLAEARVHGKLILAPDSEQAREIADQALLPYNLGQSHSIGDSLVGRPPSIYPDPAPFERASYFEWLLRSEF